jgi:peptidoglycan/xylan/chitin deacetylase (PgdA/CDA1 family)
VVLMYHGVVNRLQDAELDRWCLTTQEFGHHLDFLVRAYRVVPLDEVVVALASGGPLPADAVALTFDDALANVFMNARPLLRERGLPYTVAVPMGLVGCDETVWSMGVRLLLLRTSRCALDLPYYGGTASEPLGTRALRLRAANRLTAELRAADDGTRRQRLDLLGQQLSAGEWEQLMAGYADLRLMTADQLRQLHAEGVTLAAHGWHHSPLEEREAPEVMAREVDQAKAALEALLGAPVDYFIFPYGVAPPAARQRVAAADYRAAFTTRSDCVRPGQDPFDLPRIAAECTLAHLRSQLAACRRRQVQLETA